MGFLKGNIHEEYPRYFEEAGVKENVVLNYKRILRIQKTVMTQRGSTLKISREGNMAIKGSNGLKRNAFKCITSNAHFVNPSVDAKQYKVIVPCNCITSCASVFF